MGVTRAVAEVSVYAVLPFVTIVALGVGFVVVFRQRAAARRAAAPGPAPAPAVPPPARTTRHVDGPWWGNPWPWVGLCAASILLGLLVWPGLFGGVVIVLPFVWIGRPRREPRMDPRTNGHTRRDAGAFTGD
jgi:hypothetical protein